MILSLFSCAIPNYLAAGGGYDTGRKKGGYGLAVGYNYYGELPVHGKLGLHIYNTGFNEIDLSLGYRNPKSKFQISPYLTSAYSFKNPKYYTSKSQEDEKKAFYFAGGGIQLSYAYSRSGINIFTGEQINSTGLLFIDINNIGDYFGDSDLSFSSIMIGFTLDDITFMF